MQAATRRPPFAQSLSSHISQPFARIDAIYAWRGRSFSARPIARLVSTFIAALPRFRLAEPCFHRDEDAATILSNARLVELTTRWQWNIGARSGDSCSTP